MLVGQTAFFKILQRLFPALDIFELKLVWRVLQGLFFWGVEHFNGQADLFDTFIELHRFLETLVLAVKLKKISPKT